mgnify:CR=1 FL=1
MPFYSEYLMITWIYTKQALLFLISVRSSSYNRVASVSGTLRASLIKSPVIRTRSGLDAINDLLKLPGPVKTCFADVSI